MEQRDGRWSRTEHHVRASEAACSKSCCPGERLTHRHEQRHEQPLQPVRSGALLICSPDDEAGSLDCTLYHVHRWLLEVIPPQALWAFPSSGYRLRIALSLLSHR